MSVLVIMLIFIFGIMGLFLPEMIENLEHYFDQQLLPALRNEREITTSNRFEIIFKLIIELAFPILLMIYFSVLYWIKRRNFKLFKNKEFLTFLLIALAASIPLLISLKQRKFYLVPSLPFYALAVSVIIAPFLKEKLKRFSNKNMERIKRFAFLLMILTFIISVIQFGGYSRDDKELSDIQTIAKIVSEGSIIGTTSTLCNNWNLVAYMSREGNISIDCSKNHEYLIMKKNDKNPAKKENFQAVILGLKKYKLFKKIRIQER